MKNVALTIAVAYALLFTVLAFLSGTESGVGLGVFFSNLPNVLPWLLVWATIVVAWKRTGPGGWLFLLLGCLSVWFFHTYTGPFSFALVSLPLFVVGGLLLSTVYARLASFVDKPLDE